MFTRQSMPLLHALVDDLIWLATMLTILAICFGAAAFLTAPS